MKKTSLTSACQLREREHCTFCFVISFHSRSYLSGSHHRCQVRLEGTAPVCDGISVFYGRDLFICRTQTHIVLKFRPCLIETTVSSRSICAELYRRLGPWRNAHRLGSLWKPWSRVHRHHHHLPPQLSCSPFVVDPLEQETEETLSLVKDEAVSLTW